MSAGDRRTFSKSDVLRRGLMAVSAVAALVLLFGPTWVRPVHDATGLYYDQLEGHAEYAGLYQPEYAAQRALAVFVLCLGLWATNLIPQSATGLLALALLPVLGVAPARQSFAYFGNSAVFFIVGVFIMAAAMIRTGLSKRLTLLLLQRFDRHPRLLVGGVLCSATFLAMWMPEHAVAAMMFPIVLELAETLQLKPRNSRYALALFFALAWGAIIGGTATFLGGARAPLALELLRDTFLDADGNPLYYVSFLGWMRASIPQVLVLTAVSAFILFKFVPSEISDITPATRMLNERVRALGPMSPPERRLAVLGLVTIASWIFLGHRVDLGVTAVLGAVAVCALRIAGWRDLEEFVNWGVVLMYGGAIALGSAMKDTHAMLWVAEAVLPAGQVSPWLLLVLMVPMTIGLSSVISNAAAVAVLLPVGYALGTQTVPAIHPLAMTYVIGICSGLAFALPISSPPVAICYASGYYRMLEVPRYGLPLTVIAWVVFVAMMFLYWPMVGIEITLPPGAAP